MNTAVSGAPWCARAGPAQVEQLMANTQWKSSLFRLAACASWVVRPLAPCLPTPPERFAPTCGAVFAAQGGALAGNARWPGISPSMASSSTAMARREHRHPTAGARAAFDVAVKPTTPSEEPTSLNTWNLVAGTDAHGSRRDQDRGAPAQPAYVARSPRCGARAIDACRPQPRTICPSTGGDE